MASSTSDLGFAGEGGLKRSEPVGVSAKGTPRKMANPCARTPRTRPSSVFISMVSILFNSADFVDMHASDQDTQALAERGYEQWRLRLQQRGRCQVASLTLVLIEVRNQCSPPEQTVA
jgi:hypothetical protein